MNYAARDIKKAEMTATISQNEKKVAAGRAMIDSADAALAGLEPDYVAMKADIEAALAADPGNIGHGTMLSQLELLKDNYLEVKVTSAAYKAALDGV